MAAKPRSNKKAAAASASGGGLTRWLLHCLALLLLAAGLLAGIIWLGRWSREQVRDQQRYLVPVAEIECEPPVGMERTEFLEEVRYHARLPAQLNLLEEDLPDQLREAFGKHPWVETVDDVTLHPPRRIVVELTQRTPVLAVKWDGGLRAVDRQGVLLPKNAPTRGLPLYPGEARPPRGPAGTRWGDPDVEQHARQFQAEQP